VYASALYIRNYREPDAWCNGVELVQGDQPPRRHG
jgi:hypothetical protein